MESTKSRVLRAPAVLRSPLLEGEIVVPLDIVLYLAKFLQFEDYRNFVRALWPAHDEDDVIQTTLWQLSTHTTEIEFLNGKRLNIGYNFDASRTKENRILFNVDSLLPVFGGVYPRQAEEYMGATKLQNFINMHVHLNMCSNRQYSGCPCYQLRCSGNNSVRVQNMVAAHENVVKREEPVCKYGHFHHHCSQHVRNWFDFFLTPTVLLREKPSLFDKDMAESFLRFMSNTVHLSRR